MLSNATQMMKTLEQYNQLAECILLEMNWTHSGTTAELVFNYVWTDGGKIRPNLEQEEIVVVKFKLVQEFYIKNALNDAMLAQPERINWGLNEIAFVKIEENEAFLKNYRFLSIPFHHAVILWEDERRIDIVFGDLEVESRVSLTPYLWGRHSHLPTFNSNQVKSGG
jgi:hypothetical protein